MSYLHVQGTLYCHTCRYCFRFPKKFVGPLTPSNRTNPKPSTASNHQPFQISMGVLPRPVQLRRYTNRTPRLQQNCTHKDWDKTLLGLPWCSRLEIWCSAPTLSVPHYFGKSHPSSPSLRRIGIQTPQPRTADSHTNEPHCQRRYHTHLRLTQRP